MARRKSSVTAINDGIDALDDFLQSLQNLSLNNNDKVVPSNQNKKIAPQSQKSIIQQEQWLRKKIQLKAQPTVKGGEKN